MTMPDPTPLEAALVRALNALPPFRRPPEPITSDTAIRRLTLDSLDAVEVATTMEEALGIEIDDQIAVDLLADEDSQDCVREVAARLARTLNGDTHG